MGYSKKNKYCPLCKSKNYKKIETAMNVSRPTEGVNVYLCGECRTEFTRFGICNENTAVPLDVLFDQKTQLERLFEDTAISGLSYYIYPDNILELL